MSEQNGKQATAKQHRKRQTNKQNSHQATVLPRPTDNDKEAWKVYWETQGHTWRTEPEIDVDRQQFLAARQQSIMPNVEQGIYPFKGIKLAVSGVTVE